MRTCPKCGYKDAKMKAQDAARYRRLVGKKTQREKRRMEKP